jgi:hypothetical protein
MQKMITISVLSVFLYANGMKDEQKQTIDAVRKYLSTSLPEKDKNNKEQLDLSATLERELQKAPWILLYDNNAQLDHNNQRFVVAYKEHTVLKIYKLADDEFVSTK